MTLWPDTGARRGEEGGPPGDWSGLSAAVREAEDAPPVDLAEAEPDATAAAPDLGVPAGHRARIARSKARIRALAAFALLVSTGVHAAALTFFLDHLNRPGVEAETNAVSVEIVLDAPPQPTVAATSGATADVIEEEVEAEEIPAPAPKPEALASQPLEPDLTDEEPQQPEIPPAMNGAKDSPAEVPPEETIARQPAAAKALKEAVAPHKEEEPTGASEPAPPEQPTMEPAQPEEPTAKPLREDAMAEAPAETVNAPTPPPSAETPATEPQSEALAYIVTPEVGAPIPTPRPAYEPPAKAKETRDERTGPPEKAARPPDEKPSAASPKRETARNAAPTNAGSTGARGGASAGEKAKYGQKLLSHVQRYKRYPEAAARRKITGATKLAITIDRAGRLTGARVATGSGHEVLDEAALAAARRAAPYPRPPDGVGGETFGFAVTMRFSR